MSPPTPSAQGGRRRERTRPLWSTGSTYLQALPAPAMQGQCHQRRRDCGRRRCQCNQLGPGAAVRLCDYGIGASAAAASGDAAIAVINNGQSTLSAEAEASGLHAATASASPPGNRRRRQRLWRGRRQRRNRQHGLGAGRGGRACGRAHQCACDRDRRDRILRYRARDDRRRVRRRRQQRNARGHSSCHRDGARRPGDCSRGRQPCSPAGSSSRQRPPAAAPAVLDNSGEVIVAADANAHGSVIAYAIAYGGPGVNQLVFVTGGDATAEMKNSGSILCR